MRGGRFLWLAIVGAVAVLGYAALQWRELAIRWHVAELERQDAETELPVDLVTARDDTAAREALVRYCRTPAGKERLLRSYLAIVESSRGEVARFLRHSGSGGITALLLLWMPGGRTIDGLVARDSPPVESWKCLLKLSSYLDRSPDDLGLRLQELLIEVGYDEYPLLRHPGARFSIVSGPGAEKPGTRVFPDAFIWGSHACLIESDPFRLDPPSGPGR